jgi:hypothetical protein
MRDLGIADRLRAAGLRVVEVAGWQTAGSDSFAPGGSVNHHTAGPSSGSSPSLLTCIEGRPDLPGPLCSVYQSREPSTDIAYVIASGRANHAGEGSWRGLSGNASVYGLEVEHDGTTALPQARIEYAARIHAAMFTGDPGMVCQHREWTTRKIDAATNVDGDDFRALVARYRNPDDEDDDMRATFDLLRDKRDNKLWRVPLDGSTRVQVTSSEVKELDLFRHAVQGGNGQEVQIDSPTEYAWLDSIPIGRP